MSDRPLLTLAHSPDPDDAFMWWPITGKVPASAMDRDRASVLSPPAIDTGRFRFRAVPGDIETLNRRAAERADLDITALSARAYADAAAKYVITACGASFGDGYGPKVVCRADAPLRCDGCLREQRPVIAVPGARTTAFLVLSLLVGARFDFVEMPFHRIVEAVAQGRVGAGLIIHEAQLTFQDAGLRQLVDVGAWWGEWTGLPLPLGLNAVRRDLDRRHGSGAIAEVAATLRRSVAHANAHRAESLDYAMSFAMGNLHGPEGPPSPALVARFVDMYVNRWTVDMGDAGRGAIARLLSEGAAAGLCTDPGPIETV
ncbi:MAG: menaquinone biosynthesis family protein [Phycisphaerales bacterium]